MKVQSWWQGCEHPNNVLASFWPPFLYSTSQHGWHEQQASHLRLRRQPLRCKQELVDDRVSPSIHKDRVSLPIRGVAATQL